MKTEAIEHVAWPAPVPYSPPVVGTLVRLLPLLLAVLVGCGSVYAIAAPRRDSLLTRHASLEVLFADVDRGLVHEVYQDGQGVVWRQDGARTWSAAKIDGLTNTLAPIQNMGDVLAEAAAVNDDVDLQVRPEGSWAGLEFAGLLGGFGAFLLLIFGPPPRQANRWAWFWMLCVGRALSLGVFAFLLLGARWPRPPDVEPGLHRKAPQRIDGRTGFGIALLAGIGVLILGALLQHYLVPGRAPNRAYEYGTSVGSG